MDPVVSDRSLLTVHPLLARRRYSRDTAEDIPAVSKLPAEEPIDLAPIKTEHSERSYRTYTSMCFARHGALNRLTIVAKPNPHESNPYWLDVYLYSCEGGPLALETPVLSVGYA